MATIPIQGTLEPNTASGVIIGRIKAFGATAKDLNIGLGGSAGGTGSGTAGYSVIIKGGSGDSNTNLANANAWNGGPVIIAGGAGGNTSGTDPMSAPGGGANLYLRGGPPGTGGIGPPAIAGSVIIGDQDTDTTAIHSGTSLLMSLPLSGLSMELNFAANAVIFTGGNSATPAFQAASGSPLNIRTDSLSLLLDETNGLFSFSGADIDAGGQSVKNVTSFSGSTIDVVGTITTTYPLAGSLANSLLRLDSSAAATNGVQTVYAPAIRQTGAGWNSNTVASVSAVIVTQAVPQIVASANPTIDQVFMASIAGGSNNEFIRFQSTGAIDMSASSGATLSAAGHVKLRSNAGVLEASQNGGAYAVLGGGTTGNWSFSGNDADRNASGALTIGAGGNATSLTIMPATTISGALTVSPTTNQLTLGASAHKVIISSTAPAAASQTLTIPDTGGSDTFEFLGLAQTITGTKTFSGFAPIAQQAIANTFTTGLSVITTTAATSGNQKFGGVVESQGNTFDSTAAASKATACGFLNRGIQTAGNPTSEMVFVTRSNTGTWSEFLKFAPGVTGSSTVMTVAAGDLTVSAPGNFFITINGTQKVQDNGANLFPVTDNNHIFGAKANRWKGVFNSASLSASYNTQSGTTYTVVTTDCYVGMSNSGARTVTLCAANALPAGGMITVKDENGNAATNNVTIARAGTDTIDGGTSAVINTNFGVKNLVSDGSAKWFLV